MQKTFEQRRSEFGAMIARREEAAQREAAAKTAVETARTEREVAERALPALKRESDQAVKEQAVSFEAEVKMSRDYIERGRKLEQQQRDQERPETDERALARSFLYATANVNAGRVLQELATRDQPAGSYYEAIRRSAAALERLVFVGLSAEDVAQRIAVELDELNCLAWRSFVARVRWIAGEVER